MMFCKRIGQCLLFIVLTIPLASTAAIPVKSMVVFGDSLSDVGNTTHLLKSLRQEADPAYIVAPFKSFVLNKMVDFANEYYVPQRVLNTGLLAVTNFFDNELAPYLTNFIAQVRLVPIIPAKPYWQNRFSNGKVWSEYFAELSAIQKNDEEVYSNRAFAGSWAATYARQLTVWNLIRHPIGTIKTLIVGKLIPPSLGLSVQAYLLEHQQLNNESIYFIFSGGNDYLNILLFEDNYNLTVMSKYIDNVLDGLSSAVTKLAQAGAQRFVIMGLPQLGDTPKFINTSDRDVLNAAVAQHNERLQHRIEQWRTLYPETDFLFIDTQSYLNKALAEPERFGFTNTTASCIDIAFPILHALRGSPFATNYVLQYAQMMHSSDEQLALGEQAYHVCSEPNSYLFWDDIHPSTRAHRYLAFEVCTAMKEHGYDLVCMEPA